MLNTFSEYIHIPKKFEDTKWVIRNRKSNRDNKYNGQENVQTKIIKTLYRT